MGEVVMNIATALHLGLLAVWAVLFVCYFKAGRLLQCLFFTAFTGLGALGLLWILGHFIALPVSITPLSAAISTVLGIPGTFLLLILHLI